VRLELYRLWHNQSLYRRTWYHSSTAQKILGYSDIRKPLAIYTHATDSMQDSATATLEEALS
jgi:hypothetical protein